MKKFAVIGTYVLDIVMKGYHTKHIRPDNISFLEECSISTGGNACNVAVNMGKLGLNVSAFGKVTNDSFGEIIITKMQHAGVNTQHMLQEVNDKGLGISTIFVENNGEKSILQYVGVNETFDIPDSLFYKLLSYDYVIITGLGLIPEINKKFIQLTKYLHENNIKVIADTSAYVKSLVNLGKEKYLQFVDYFMPNEREALDLSGCENIEQAADYFMDKGVKNIIIKLGEEGCYFKNKYISYYIDACKVKAVDTTGAGDAFLSGFMFALNHDYPLKEAVLYANQIGAKCVTKIGATEGVSKT